MPLFPSPFAALNPLRVVGRLLNGLALFVAGLLFGGLGAAACLRRRDRDEAPPFTPAEDEAAPKG